MPLTLTIILIILSVLTSFYTLISKLVIFHKNNKAEENFEKEFKNMFLDNER